MKAQDTAMSIFWIASYPKSGNTWLRAFLANVLAPKRPVDVNRLKDFCAIESSIHWAMPLMEPGQSEVLGDRAGMELRQRMQQRILDVNAGRHVFIKTHNRYGTYHGLPLIRPDLTLGAVYLVRDPRDVAVSLKHHWGSGQEDTLNRMETPDAFAAGRMGEQIFEVMGSWSEHVQSWTTPAPKNTIVLRYEDCVADPDKTFGRVARLLKLTQDETVIREAIEATSFSALKKQEEEKGFRERPEKSPAFFRKGKAGGWREALTPKQAERVERKNAQMMKRFGYAFEHIEGP